MTRGLASLVAVLLVGFSLGGASRQQLQQYGTVNAKPFQAGYEYTFTYNGQISTGIKDGQSSAVEPQQQSSTRLQAQCKVQFQSGRHATLRLEQIRIGYLNQLVQNPQQVKPMGMFEQKQIEPEKHEELKLPCQFSYVDGVVERIEFHPEDSTWSKNIKRAVLNMLQLNLKRNNAQGLRQTEDVSAGQKMTQQQNIEGVDEQQSQQMSSVFGQNSFTLPEMTIEGECQTTYTINKYQKGEKESSSESNENDDEEREKKQSGSCSNCFNVTKSINFKQCSKIADVAFGYQTLQLQPQCAQCQSQWQQQQQQFQQGGQQQQQQQLPYPCNQCDPKEVKENKLDRSTVLRYVLQGKKEKYGIKRVELVSQYVYKNLRSENGQYGASLTAVVASELILRDASQCNSPKCSNYQQKEQQMKASSEQSEQLMYSNAWDVEEKRFYMYGDDEFVGRRASPFSKVQNKQEQAIQIIRKLASAASDKSGGIEVEVAVQLQRLAELLRMCTVQELKDIQGVLSRSQSGNQRGDIEQQKIEHIFADALAIAGTRNTIFVLVEKVLNHQISATKAAQTLNNLQGLPAPSDVQIDQVLRLCKNEITHRSQALKQSCWLTFGSMVGELCQHKTQKSAQQSVFGAQSGFSKEEVCPMHKKEIYKQTLIEQFQQAETTYEQVLALKALGNAGLDIAVNKLEQIIQDQSLGRIPRIQAIDALRRLRDVMPRKIQRILLPVFQNIREQPEVRIAAFSMIMHTQPEQPVIDQIAYTLTKEGSKQVQSYVYTTMKSLSKSHVPCKQQLAKHLKNALKLANVDENSLRGSLKYQVPIYSHEQKEGIFLTLSSVFNKRNTLPTHLSARIDTMLNEEFGMNALKIGFTQKDIEGWYERLVQMWGNSDNDDDVTPTRGQRSERRGHEELRKIFSGLKIKSRQSAYNRDGQRVSDAPFAMVCLRVGDVDQAILPIDQEHMPRCLQQLLQGQKPSLSGLMNEPQHFRFFAALNPMEKFAKLPTSCGIPIRILTSSPILTAVEGQLKVASGNGLESTGPKLQLQLHATVTAAHIRRVETWLPIFCVGAESIQSVEINVPLQLTAQAGQQGQQQMPGVQITIKVPQAQKTRVFGIHTLPITYIREFDPKTKMQREPRVKTVHNEKLEQLQREINTVVGEHTHGMPFHMKGHYHMPANPTDYQQLIQILMATENQLHVTFEPIPESTPKEIRLRLSAQAFQKIAGGSVVVPELGQFYTNSAKFEYAYPEQFEDMDDEDHNERREKLNQFLGQYKPKQVYKHQLKASIETVGGRKQCKAQMEVKGQCDAQGKYCKAQVEVQRTPIYASENGQWTLKSTIQIVTPESVSSVQQLGQVSGKHQKFVCMAETQWGAESKQFINLRIQGSNAKNTQWRQIESQLNSYYKRLTAFINKYDVIADYKLKPEMQNLCSRGFEALKAYNFWNTESKLLSQQQQPSREGQIHATVVIDPITQKHANLSVKTNSQAVRIENIELPTKLRPLQLVRQNPQKSTHSFVQLFSGLKANGRAECQVDGQRVNTFDDVIYKAPLSKCYSVLAKDCSSEKPQFAVLMKCQQSGGSQGCSSRQGKKLMVLTSKQSVECQPKANNQQKLQCKVNGEIVQEMSSESNYDENIVEYNNEEKTSVTINVHGVWVRFNGKKAVIKLSNAYKNGQCGLCGHYNDDADDVLRMNNNELTSNIAQFHQSYSVLDNDECSQSEQQEFYQQQTSKFEMDSEENNLWEEDDQGYASSSQEGDDDEETFDEDDSWWGTPRYYQQRSYDRRGSKQQQKRSCWPNCGESGEQGSQWAEEPIKQTKVVEYNHKICFSAEPIRQCPEGTTPAGADGQPLYGDDSSEENTKKQQQQPKKMQFTCLPRSSVEARRLQRQARRGVIVDVGSLSPSFLENVKQPQSCIRY